MQIKTSAVTIRRQRENIYSSLCLLPAAIIIVETKSRDSLQLFDFASSIVFYSSPASEKSLAFYTK